MSYLSDRILDLEKRILAVENMVAALGYHEPDDDNIDSILTNVIANRPTMTAHKKHIGKLGL